MHDNSDSGSNIWPARSNFVDHVCVRLACSLGTADSL